MEVLTSVSEKKTGELGFKTAKRAVLSSKNRKKALVFLLIGNLGSGKTAFVRGFASFFGIKRILSPTFNIFRSYPVKKNGFLRLIHADFYRIKNRKELEEIGFFKKLSDKKNIILIEWPEIAGDNIHGKKIFFLYGGKENERKIKVNY